MLYGKMASVAHKIPIAGVAFSENSKPANCSQQICEDTPLQSDDHCTRNPICTPLFTAMGSLFGPSRIIPGNSFGEHCLNILEKGWSSEKTDYAET